MLKIISLSAKKSVTCLALAVLLLLHTTYAQAQTSAFQALNSSDKVTNVYLSSFMLKMGKMQMKMQGNLDPFSMQLMDCTSTMNIYLAEEEPGMKLIRSTFKTLSSNKKEPVQLLMQAKDEESNVNLFVNPFHNSVTDRIYLVVETPKSIVAIVFRGKYTMKDIEQLVEQSNKK